MSRPASKESQITRLKDVFRRLNPGIGEDLVDWEAEVDSTLTLNENRIELEKTFPEYTWFDTDRDRSRSKTEIIKEKMDRMNYVLNNIPADVRADAEKLFSNELRNYRANLDRKDKKITELNKQLKEREMGITREEKQPTKAPGEPKPPPAFRISGDVEKELKTDFDAKLVKAGVTYSNKKPAFDQLIRQLKQRPGLTIEEAKAEVDDLGEQIIGVWARSRGMKFEPMGAREREISEGEASRRIEPIPRDEEGEGFEETQRAFYNVELDRNAAPFPRAPTGSEDDRFYENFLQQMESCGKYLEPSLKQTHTKYFSSHTYKTADAMFLSHERLIEAICGGKEPQQPYDLISGPLGNQPSIEGWLGYWLSRKYSNSLLPQNNLGYEPFTWDEVIAAVESNAGPVQDDDVKNLIRAWVAENDASIPEHKPYPHPMIVAIPRRILEEITGLKF